MKPITTVIKTFLAILILLNSNALWSKNLSTAKDKATKATQTACKNLTKVNDLEELLLQFYMHIDNGCLLNTPVKVLEDSWGVDILDLSKFGTFSLFDTIESQEKILANRNRAKEHFFNKTFLTSKRNILITKDCFEDESLCYFDITVPISTLVKQKSLFKNNLLPPNLPPPTLRPRKGQRSAIGMTLYDTVIFNKEEAEHYLSQDRFELQKPLANVNSNYLPKPLEIKTHRILKYGSLVNQINDFVMIPNYKDTVTFYYIREEDMFSAIKAPSGDFDCHYVSAEDHWKYFGSCLSNEYIWEKQKGRIKIRLEENYRVRSIRVELN